MVTAESVILSFKRYVTSPVEFGYLLNDYADSGQLRRDGYKNMRHFLLLMVTRTNTSYSLRFLKSLSSTTRTLKEAGIEMSDIQHFNFQELRSALKVMESKKMDKVAFLRYLEEYRNEKQQGVVLDWKKNRRK